MHLEDHTMLDTKLVLVMFSLLLIKVLTYLFVRFFVLICTKKQCREKPYEFNVYQFFSVCREGFPSYTFSLSHNFCSRTTWSINISVEPQRTKIPPHVWTKERSLIHRFQYKGSGFKFLSISASAALDILPVVKITFSWNFIAIVLQCSFMHANLTIWYYEDFFNQCFHEHEPDFKN